MDIAVIRLPRISNFTDFNPLQMLPQVNLRYVARRQELGNPDLIILPGTKNTMADLKWMRQNGLEAAVLKHAARGGAVLGICGGYQMLGKALHDPDGVEEGGSLSGMGLLPVTTRCLSEKGPLQGCPAGNWQGMKSIWGPPKGTSRRRWSSLPKLGKAKGTASRQATCWAVMSTAC